MAVWHGDLHKTKPSAGRRHVFRKKRRFEQGSFPTETRMGDTKVKSVRGRGGSVKRKMLIAKFACVTDPKSGKTEKVEISRVVKSPANIDYDRRGVITRGAVIETSLGLARVTSRPGQDGVLNAILASREKKG